MKESLTGQIVASFGRLFIVEGQNKQTYEATTRGKRVDFVCGDWVKYSQINEKQIVIEAVLPRQSLLYRQDFFKTKMFAANVTQVGIVIAGVPSPNEELLQRALVAAEAAYVHPLIILNKTDLSESKTWQENLAFYQTLGYSLLEISAYGDIQQLRLALQGHCSIFLGQSGMGKSTLTNALLGEQIARIGDISSALDSGKHTTTHSQLYHLDNESQIIDSPGLQEFGLKQIDASNLIGYFPEMRSYVGKCRFHNCTHRQEPNCALKVASENGEIRESRLRFFQKLMNELV